MSAFTQTKNRVIQKLRSGLFLTYSDSRNHWLLESRQIDWKILNSLIKSDQVRIDSFGHYIWNERE